jgi:hypothetical protein
LEQATSPPKQNRAAEPANVVKNSFLSMKLNLSQPSLCIAVAWIDNNRKYFGGVYLFHIQKRYVNPRPAPKL